jgi:drug/metabolite transporter (DMT)-like permease
MTFFLGLSGSHTREIGALCYQPVTFALAILYILCQGSYIVSYQHAELSFLGPLKFLKTPLAAVLDYHFFTVVASQRDIIAGMMIITGVILGYISKNMTQKTPEQTAY